jgi:hypothetical protein
MSRRAETLRKRSRGKRAVEARAVEPPIKAEPAASADALTEETIRLHAFWKWEHAGRPPGDGVTFWLEAEQELQRTRDMNLGQSSTSHSQVVQ